jgi:hypothetical protein
MRFQDQVMEDFCQSLYHAVLDADSDGAELLITDRTPYDYASYYLNVFQAQLTLEHIYNKREQADVATIQLLNHCNSILLTPLPWPMPWSKDTVSSDGWRADKTGKNFLWSSVLTSELVEAERRNRHKEIEHRRLVPFTENGTIEVRAACMMASVFPNLHRGHRSS